MNPTPPPFSSALRQRLTRHGPEALALAQQFHARLRPCVWMKARRVGQAPLHRPALARWLGFRPDAPRLPLLDSKWGGAPYATADLTLAPGHRFLGQIDFARLPPGVLPGLPRRGLLGLDQDIHAPGIGLRTRWYPQPSEAEAVPVTAVRCVGRFEAALDSSPGWSGPPGDALEDVLHTEDPELVELWDAWAEQALGQGEKAHRLGGPVSLEPDALGAFHPAPGQTHELEAYEQLLWLTSDPAADFAWGSNWLSLFIPREDLAAGRLDRLAFAHANA